MAYESLKLKVDANENVEVMLKPKTKREEVARTSFSSNIVDDKVEGKDKPNTKAMGEVVVHATVSPCDNKMAQLSFSPFIMIAYGHMSKTI